MKIDKLCFKYLNQPIFRGLRLRINSLICLYFEALDIVIYIVKYAYKEAYCYVLIVTLAYYRGHKSKDVSLERYISLSIYLYPLPEPLEVFEVFVEATRHVKLTVCGFPEC